MTRERPAGVCRFCGCSEYDGCYVDDGVSLYPVCSWTDRTRSVCTVCAPAAKAEAIALRTLAKAGYRSERPGLKAPLEFVAAFHAGFVVGWFGISPRSPYGRNPFTKLAIRHPQREAWDLGQRRGAEASRVYQSACGPLTNAPRKEVLQERRRRSRGARSKSTTTQVTATVNDCRWAMPRGRNGEELRAARHSALLEDTRHAPRGMFFRVDRRR